MISDSPAGGSGSQAELDFLNLFNANFVDKDKKSKSINQIINRTQEANGVCFLNEVSKATVIKGEGAKLILGDKPFKCYSGTKAVELAEKKGKYKATEDCCVIIGPGITHDSFTEAEAKNGALKEYLLGNKNVKEFALAMKGDTLLICIHNNSNMKLEPVIEMLTNIEAKKVTSHYILGIDHNCTKLTDAVLSSQLRGINYTNVGNTTNKNRTMLQSQWAKATGADESRKDLIISNLPISHPMVSRVSNIDTGDTDNTGLENLIPNEHHLFDHFIVTATIEEGGGAAAEGGGRRMRRSRRSRRRRGRRTQKRNRSLRKRRRSLRRRRGRRSRRM